MRAVNHGLVGYAVAGWASVGMIVFSFVVVAGIAGRGEPSAGAAPLLMVVVFFGTAAVVFLGKYYRTTRFRQQCLRHQVRCAGRVEDHGRAFNPFSSTRRYTLRVGYQCGGPVRWESVVLPGSVAVGRYPVGSVIEGWAHPGGRAYFPVG
jgi:hypothetical protein